MFFSLNKLSFGGRIDLSFFYHFKNEHVCHWCRSAPRGRAEGIGPRRSWHMVSLERRRLVPARRHLRRTSRTAVPRDPAPATGPVRWLVPWAPRVRRGQVSQARVQPACHSRRGSADSRGVAAGTPEDRCRASRSACAARALPAEADGVGDILRGAHHR